MTHINDFRNNVVLANDGNSLPPAVRTASANGAWVDLRDTDGNGFALQNVGVVSGTTPTLDTKLQEADDAAGTGAQDIAGATFTQVTASNKTQAINFKRTKGFVRAVATIAGTTPSFPSTVIVSGQRKAV